MQRESSPDTLRSLRVYVLVCAQVCVYVEVGGWHCLLQLLSSWFFNQSIIVCVYVPQRMCGGQRRACSSLLPNRGSRGQHSGHQA